MSCTYKPHNPVSDGPADLYHRMNQIDCAMKKFGGSVYKSKTRSKSKPKSKSKPASKTASKPASKSSSKTASKHRKSHRRPK